MLAVVGVTVVGPRANPDRCRIVLGDSAPGFTAQSRGTLPNALALPAQSGQDHPACNRLCSGLVLQHKWCAFLRHL
jgi:hypothetical protein